MEISLQEVLSKIEQADDIEINEIMDAVRKRFTTAFPDWEILYISCPKNDPTERQRTVDFFIRYFQTHT